MPNLIHPKYDLNFYIFSLCYNPFLAQINGGMCVCVCYDYNEQQPIHYSLKSVQVIRNTNVQTFGPTIPDILGSDQLRDFLLLKSKQIQLYIREIQ